MTIRINEFNNGCFAVADFQRLRKRQIGQFGSHSFVMLSWVIFFPSLEICCPLK